MKLSSHIAASPRPQISLFPQRKVVVSAKEIEYKVIAAALYIWHHWAVPFELLEYHYRTVGDWGRLYVMLTRVCSLGKGVQTLMN